MEKIYSNRIWISFLHFMEKRFGKETADKVLAAAGTDRLALADPSGFQTLEFGKHLVEAATSITGEEDISYKSGREFADSLGKAGGLIIGLTSPEMCMRLLGKTESRIALKTVTDTETVGRNQYRVRVSFKDGFQEIQAACRNRVGIYESLPRAFGLPFGKVEHPRCVFRGDAQCEYLVTFPEHGFIVLKKIGVLLFLLSAVLGAWGAIRGGGPPAALPIGAMFASLLAYSLYKHRQARLSLQWTLLTNEGLSATNRELEKDNSRIQSLQELTVTLSHSQRVQETCETLVKALVKDFGFGSSQIWLLDADRKFLSNRAAKGYNPDIEAFIRNTRFEMGRDWDNPYGLLSRTLEQGQTLLVNDVPGALEKLTPRTRDFISALNTSAFIITPLIHNKAAIGLITGEHHGRAKLDNKDRMLFLSISNIAANALVNAEFLERMEEKIRQRTQELEAANRQLLTAKEMAIQSEKLSSLGQMAAGVAHEINNPLNFLVNIIPDVKRDLEAMVRLRELALPAITDAGVLGAIRELEEKSELEEHLGDREFVFSRIQKALEKSTRIANSLKVFSRSSTKEATGRERFAAMLQEVVDLIPRKVRGDTRIELDIPPGLDWIVNKNEIEQAFLALINNAIDAMGQKGCLRIEAMVGESELTLLFKDEGPGIPADSLKRIFDPFYTTKPPGKGTGLGLTIASEIVRKYGGSLSAASEVGKGTTFFIRFRREARSDSAAEIPSAAA